jgi:hypothetical protein
VFKNLQYVHHHHLTDKKVAVVGGPFIFVDVGQDQTLAPYRNMNPSNGRVVTS